MLALSALAFLLCFRPRTFPRLIGLPRQWLAAALLAGGPLLLLLGLPSVPVPEGGSGPGTGLTLAQEMPRVLTLGSLGLMLTLLLIASLFDAQGEARLRRLKRSLHQARLRLTYTTRHDLLTRLLNRPAFEEHLQRAVDAASLQQTQPVVLLIEIDDFRTYNSAWGAAAGDQMLQQVAGRLKEMARPKNVVARIGWEQFALLMKQVESPREMSRTATRIVRALARPLKMPHGPTHLIRTL